MIPEDYIISIDEELINQGVPLYSRPMGVLARWMRDKGIRGSILDKRLYTPLREAYDRLYPDGDFGTPPMLEGGVGFRDQVFPVRANIAYGTVSIDPKKCIEISDDSLLKIWRNYPEQVWRSYYVVADVWDFAYGVSDIHGCDEAVALLGNAHGHVTSAARALQAKGDGAAAVQSACLVAELAMKGVLAHKGMSEPDRRRLNHRLPDMVEKIIAIASSPNDEHLRASAQSFPNFIDSRYQHHGMNKVDLINLMHSSQFIAAEAVRRVTNRNLAAQMNASADVPNRETW